MERVNCLDCDYRHPDNGNCTAVGGFCTAVPAAHCPLIPELRKEIKELKLLMHSSKVFTATILLEQSEIDRCNELLNLPSEEYGVQNAGYDEDSTVVCFMAEFEDGCFADIKICSGQENFFCDSVLFNRDGCEVCTLECPDSLDGDYEFEYGGDYYKVTITSKEGSAVQDGQAPLICKHCNTPIVENEDFVRVGNDFYHENCFLDTAAGIMLEKQYAVSVRRQNETIRLM